MISPLSELLLSKGQVINIPEYLEKTEPLYTVNENVNL
jgi:hypothetical protein